jgi:predicted MFS family arabinose efflux permease
MLGSLAIAFIVRTTDFSRPALLIAVFAVGTGAALQGPVFLAVTPSLVPKEHLAGAISLNSVSMNVSRVVGPAIGAVLYVWIGASWVFVLNAATYVIIMVGITYVKVPVFERKQGESKLDRLFGGFRYVRQDPVVSRAVLTVFLFSMFCMPFVVLYPALASTDWGVSSKSTLYGLLYATFGLGAVVGALSVGTFLSGHKIENVLRGSFVMFGVSLAAYITIDSPIPAFPIGFLLGFFYFAVVTSLSTIFQSRLDHSIRGRVSAVWMMCFGGTVPVAGLIAGWIVSHSTVNTVVYFGAAFALFLAWFADLRPPEQRKPVQEPLRH